MQLNRNQEAEIFSFKIVCLSLLGSVSFFGTNATYEVCCSFCCKPLLSWAYSLMVWAETWAPESQPRAVIYFFFLFSASLPPKLKQGLKYMFISRHFSSRITTASCKIKCASKRNFIRNSLSFSRLQHSKQLTNYTGGERGGKHTGR